MFLLERQPVVHRKNNQPLEMDHQGCLGMHVLLLLLSENTQVIPKQTQKLVLGINRQNFHSEMREKALFFQPVGGPSKKAFGDIYKSAA